MMPTQSQACSLLTAAQCVLAGLQRGMQRIVHMQGPAGEGCGSLSILWDFVFGFRFSLDPVAGKSPGCLNIRLRVQKSRVQHGCVSCCDSAHAAPCCACWSGNLTWATCFLASSADLGPRSTA